MPQPYHILVVHFPMNLQLATLVTLITPYLFDSHNLICACHLTHEHFCESSVTHLDFGHKFVFHRERTGPIRTIVNIDTTVVI